MDIGEEESVRAGVADAAERFDGLGIDRRGDVLPAARFRFGSGFSVGFAGLGTAAGRGSVRSSGGGFWSGETRRR